ncbi:hypothetical protein F4560_006569 [Saccharothrix ecbatanensis]|uniref:Uncharacterized protein n=1 Tax=Saccharothrix ecbatanensis TaxID=1105145 RepID=A0A7W9M473_9PSEU|nr:hypothetical protein [Saccharothrix ecbatanensis]
MCGQPLFLQRVAHLGVWTSTPRHPGTTRRPRGELWGWSDQSTGRPSCPRVNPRVWAELYPGAAQGDGGPDLPRRGTFLCLWTTRSQPFTCVFGCRRTTRTSSPAREPRPIGISHHVRVIRGYWRQTSRNRPWFGGRSRLHTRARHGSGGRCGRRTRVPATVRRQIPTAPGCGSRRPRVRRRHPGTTPGEEEDRIPPRPRDGYLSPRQPTAPPRPVHADPCRPTPPNSHPTACATTAPTHHVSGRLTTRPPPTRRATGCPMDRRGDRERAGDQPTGGGTAAVCRAAAVWDAAVEGWPWPRVGRAAGRAGRRRGRWGWRAGNVGEHAGWVARPDSGAFVRALGGGGFVRSDERLGSAGGLPLRVAAGLRHSRLASGPACGLAPRSGLSAARPGTGAAGGAACGGLQVAGGWHAGVQRAAAGCGRAPDTAGGWRGQQARLPGDG